jgi:hypothetical protein
MIPAMSDAGCNTGVRASFDEHADVNAVGLHVHNTSPKSIGGPSARQRLRQARPVARDDLRLKSGAGAVIGSQARESHRFPLEGRLRTGRRRDALSTPVPDLEGP